MIAFITLLLGIVTGTETFALRVDDAVHHVDLQLDGALVQVLEQRPWKARIDFGPRPKPHHLAAIARALNGDELGRAEQWLNLPQPAAHASVAIERRSDGSAIAHLSWESLAGASPQRVDASFDGKPLTVTDATRIPIAPFDDDALHFLRIELVFTDSVSSLIERTLGGTYTDSVATELTAVPIIVDKARRKLAIADLQGSLISGGQTLEVVAVENGPSIAVMVADRSAFGSLSAQIDPRRSRQQIAAGAAWLTLGKKQRLRFLWPVTQRQLGASRSYDLFNLSSVFKAHKNGVYHLIRNVRRPHYTEIGQQRLADAVANAALEATSRRRSRAVILVLGTQPEDHSTLTPPQVRDFLADLQVPLLVWSVKTVPEISPWGEARSISDPQRLASAVHDLSRQLKAQRIVWVDGIHLPQTLRLHAVAQSDGLRLVR